MSHTLSPSSGENQTTTRRHLSESRRLALSVIARRRWGQTPVEVREERAAKARATVQARYPHRQALYDDLKARIASGDLRRESCDQCGGEGAMRLAYDDEARTVEIVGWRCYPCRKATK